MDNTIVVNNQTIKGLYDCGEQSNNKEIARLW